MAMEGFNFRNVLEFVTDGADEYFVDDAALYPTSGASVDYGWDTGGDLQDRDRNASLDRRLAGVNFLANNVAHDRTFIINTGVGAFDVRLAIGDAVSASEPIVSIYDYSTSNVRGALLAQVVNGTALTDEQSIDAMGTVMSQVDWPNNNVVRNVTVTGGRIGIVIGSTSVDTSFTALQHVAWGTPSMTVTGPDTATEGVGVDVAGTLFSGVTDVDIQLAGDATSAVAQPFSGETATTVTLTTVRNALTQPTGAIAGEVDGIPFNAGVTMGPNTTAYDLEWKVVNGNSNEAVYPVTLSPAAGSQTIQTMAVDANTDIESVFYTGITVTATNNMQATISGVVGSTIASFAADGVFQLTNPETITTFDVTYYDPDTTQLSYAQITTLAYVPPADTAPSFTDPTNETVSVPENTAAVGNTINSAVGVPTPQYRLDGVQDNLDFTIDINTGALTFKNPPDFETDSLTYAPIITAFNTEDTATRTIDITIIDIVETSVKVTCRRSDGFYIPSGQTVRVSIYSNFAALDNNSSPIYSNTLQLISGNFGEMEIISPLLGNIADKILVCATYQGEYAIYEATVIDVV